MVFRILMLVVMGLLLTGCVNKEPEHRAAFTAWLQTQDAATHVLPLPRLERSERAAFGDYAEHYDLLADFDDTARGVAATLARALEHDELHSLAELLARHETLSKDQQALANARESLQRALQQAQADLLALEQPADMQPVYAQVYERVISRRAAQLDTLLSAASAAVGDALSVAEFADRHREQITVTAESASVRDPSVQLELNRLINNLNDHAAAIRQAQNDLRALEAQ